MARKSNKPTKNTIIAVTFLVAIILTLVGAIGTYMSVVDNQQMFSIAGSGGGLNLQQNVVYMPQFTTTQCTVIKNDHTIEYDWANRQDSNGWITQYCGRNNHDVYTNRCQFEITRTASSSFTPNAYLRSFYICPIGTNFEDRNSQCRSLDGSAGAISFTRDEFVLSQAKNNLGLRNVREGELKFKIVANWFGLRTIDSSNFLSQQVTCDVSRIQQRGFTFLKDEKEDKAPTGILGFDQFMNYVSGVSPAISKNVIQYRGNEVWTNGNQQYCNIKEDINGVRFVDVTDCNSAPSLICNPATPFCSDDGTEFINIDSTGGSTGGKTCNELYGSFVNQYVPNSQDPRQVCKASCGSDGKLELNQCKTIPNCQNGQILNSNYECVGANVENYEDVESDSFLFIVMFMTGIVLVGISRYSMQGSTPMNASTSGGRRRK